MKKSICLFMAVLMLFAFSACGINRQPKKNEPDFNELDFNQVYETAADNGYNGSMDELVSALKGDSAYAIARNNGYTGSEADWLAALVGASGTNGNDGITPHIGENGNWFIGETDSGVKAQGPQGEKGESAYEIYKKYYGYEGSEKEWLDDLINGRLKSQDEEQGKEEDKEDDGLAEYKDSARTQVYRYTDSKGWDNYTDESNSAIWDIIERGIAEINSATDREGVDSAVDAAKRAIDEVPMKEFEPLDEVFLEMIGHEYFRQFGKEFQFERYYGFFNGAAVFFLVNTGRAKSVRISGVAFSYSSGWTVMAFKYGIFYDLEDTETIFEKRILTQSDIERIGAVHAEANLTENFLRYQANARTQIEAYAKGKGQENYTEENWTVILELVEKGIAAIDAAADGAEVHSALTAAKNRIDTVPRLTPVDNLQEYKAAAKAELEEYAESKGRENYTEENWKDIEYYVWAGILTIDASRNKYEVDAWVLAAKEGIDAVPQKEKELPVEELTEELLNKIKQDYFKQFGYTFWFGRFYGFYNGAAVFFSPGSAAVVKTVKISGVEFSYSSAWNIWVWKDGKIYNLEGIETIFKEKVLTQGDIEKLGVVHAEANLAEQLAWYKTSAKASLEAYAESKGQDNYTQENWSLIENLVISGKKETDTASDKAGVDLIVEKVKQAIDGIPQKEFEPLDEELAEKIKRDLFELYQMNIDIAAYYGTYNGCVVLTSSIDIRTAAVITTEVIGGITFKFGAYQIRTWYDGHFYSLKEAYELGYLTKDDLSDIAMQYNIKH